MVEIKPFAGLRPAASWVEEVAAPPYDVLSRDEATELLRTRPRSFMRVIRPDAEMDRAARGDVVQVAERGRAALQEMVVSGTMVRERSPGFYLYELELGGHRQIGVVAGTSLEAYEKGLIKRHEKTRERELVGRTHHIDVTSAHTGLTFLTYHARPEIDAFVATQREAMPLYDFAAEDGVTHRLWALTSPPAIAEAQRLFAEVPALYIADGHHRTAASAKVRQLRRQREGEAALVEDRAYDHFLGALFPHDQLRILAYNRVVTDLGGRSVAAVLEGVGERFEVSPTDRPEPESPHRFGMYLGGRWYRLAARRGSFPEDHRQRSLDVAILQENLLQPLLGITDPRHDRRLKFVGGIRGTAELEERASATGGAAFCCYPVSIEQVMAIADAGEVMPPKSTWFEPKLRSGLIVHLI